MTELRDARFKRALDAAGDEPSRPGEAARSAVHEAARRAAGAARAPWWRSLRSGSRERNAMAWSAAFATVLLAVLVGVMWQGREPPDARPGREQLAARPAENVVNGDAAPAEPGGPAAAPASPPPAMAVPDASPHAAAKSGRAEVGKRAQRPAAPAPQAASAPAISWEAWSELRIAAEGREVVLARHRATELAELLNRAARAAQVAEPAGQEPARPVVYELSTRGTLLAVLELHEDHVRFLPVGEGGPSRSLRLPAAQLQALRQETERLLPPR